MNVVIRSLVPGVTYYFNAEPLNGHGVAGGLLGEILAYSVPSAGFGGFPTLGVTLSRSPFRERRRKE